MDQPHQNPLQGDDCQGMDWNATAACESREGGWRLCGPCAISSHESASWIGTTISALLRRELHVGVETHQELSTTEILWAKVPYI
jgi:hypothetical protein